MRKVMMGAVITAIAILAVVLTLYSSRQSQKEIEIGAILPLTGGAGKYGEDAKLGIELATAQQNSMGGISGKPVKIIFEDDQSSPQQAVSGFRKLISVHKVPAVIGGMTSSSALAIAPLAEQNRIVLLSPSASTPSFSVAGDFIFRNELSDAYGGVAQAELTWNKLGIKKVAILFINNDYGIGVKDAFLKTFTSLGGRVVDAEVFDADTQDFRTQLIRIKKTSPEALFIVAYKEAILILRQVRELGIKTKLLSTPVFQDREIVEKAGGAAEGVMYVYYGGFDTKSSEEHVGRFVEEYRRRYSREPGYYSALAYDATNILFFAMGRGSGKGEDIKNALYQIKDFPGVTGKTTFDNRGDVTKPVTLKIVTNGEFVSWK